MFIVYVPRAHVYLNEVREGNSSTGSHNLPEVMREGVLAVPVKLEVQLGEE